MWQHTGTVFRWIFFQLPATSNFLLAAFGVAIIFAMKELDENLRERQRLRWGIGFLIFVFGITAFISDRVQDTIQKNDATVQVKNASAERKLLQGQIGQLISASQIQATSDEMQKLDADLSNGFRRVEEAVRGVKPSPPISSQKPAPPIGPQLPPALIQNLTVTQRRAPSSDPSLPYGLQIIIQSNIEISPVAFAFVCSGDVGKIDFFIAGQGGLMNTENGYMGQGKNIPYLKIGFPPLTPTNPLVVTLLSKDDIRVTSVQQIH